MRFYFRIMEEPKADASMFMCRLCNIFSPSRAQLLVHCSQLHPQHQPAGDILVSLQPLAGPEVAQAGPEKPQAGPEKPQAGPEKPQAGPEEPPTVKPAKRKRGRPKGSTKKSLLESSEGQAGPDLLPSETWYGREQEARPGEKESQGECHGTTASLECSKCSRSFSNRRQILKHICLKEDKDADEEDGEEDNGNVDGAKIQRTSRKGRTQAYDRTFTHQEGVPAGWNKKSVISVVLTEHETLADATKMVPVESATAEADSSASNPQHGGKPEGTEAPSVAAAGPDNPESQPTETSTDLDPASNTAYNQGFQEYSIKQVSTSLVESQLKIFTCEFCNKIFKFRHSLVAHLRTHTQEKPFQCPHCSYASAIKANLNVHLRKHTGEKFSCPHCPFISLSPGHLKVHVERVHLKVKQHCEFCQKKYSDVKNLLRHMEQRHNTKEPAVQQSYQQLRLKTRQGQRQLLYHCPTCNRRFKNQLQRERHLLVHGPQRPFGCLLCDYAATKMSALGAHVRKHLFLYVCGRCGVTCTSSQRLRAHLKERHPDAEPEQAFVDCINGSYCLMQPGDDAWREGPDEGAAGGRRGGEGGAVGEEEEGGDRPEPAEEGGDRPVEDGGTLARKDGGEVRVEPMEEEGAEGGGDDPQSGGTAAGGGGARGQGEVEARGENGEAVIVEGKSFPSDYKEAVGQKGSVEDTAEEDIAEEDITVEDTTVEDTDVGDIPVEDTATENITVEDTATENITVEDTATENITVEDTATENITVEDTATENITVEDTATENITVEDTATENITVEDTATENITVEDTATENITVEDTATENITVEEIAAEDVDEKLPGGSAPKEGVDGDSSQPGADETPALVSVSGTARENPKTQPDGADENPGSTFIETDGSTAVESSGHPVPPSARPAQTTASTDTPDSESSPKDLSPEDSNNDGGKDGSESRSETEPEAQEQNAFQKVLASLNKTQLNMELFKRLRKIYGDLECQYCGKLFWYQVHYNLHVRTHTKEHVHYCSQCDYSSITKSCLKRHVVQKHSGLLLACPSPGCRYTSPDKYKLQSHLRTHQEQVKACPVCNQNFPEYRLMHHIRNTHPDTVPQQGTGLMVKRAEKCPYCDSYFLKNSSDLQQHIWAHEGLKPFHCTVCEYASRSKSNLKAHMNRHSSERSHLCDLCGKKFKSKVTLKSHRLSHSAEGKRFHCSECEYTSVSKPALLRHMEQHAGFKPFRCAHCPYSCNISGPLKRHYSRKHPDQEYHNAGPGLPNADSLELQGGIKCPVCEFVYGTKWELNRHLKNKHNLKLMEGPGSWEVMETVEEQYVSVGEEEQQTETVVTASLPGDAHGQVNILQQIIELSSENHNAVASVVTMAPGTLTMVEQVADEPEGRGPMNQLMLEGEGDPNSNQLMVVEETEGLDALTVFTSQGDGTHHYIVYVQEQTVEID
ncbi:zinc finger protein ZFAT-like isoform X3 [Gadus macrocephalus]|uniref:zinc finger protein ZFAT-like isoform X3 n=1 Tax=Gadus macrocephalus TaxID=80720 RepID=UPI0028CB2825|nr:zinc finger protein ZFAT-like isoform X3 [Gadus macrocephalus]